MAQKRIGVHLSIPVRSRSGRRQSQGEGARVEVGRSSARLSERPCALESTRSRIERASFESTARSVAAGSVHRSRPRRQLPPALRLDLDGSQRMCLLAVARSSSRSTLLLGCCLSFSFTACAAEDAGTSSETPPVKREDEPVPAAPTPGPEVPVDTSVAVAHERELRGASTANAPTGRSRSSASSA